MDLSDLPEDVAEMRFKAFVISIEKGVDSIKADVMKQAGITKP